MNTSTDTECINKYALLMSVFVRVSLFSPSPSVARPPTMMSFGRPTSFFCCFPSSNFAHLFSHCHLPLQEVLVLYCRLLSGVSLSLSLAVCVSLS